MSRIVGSLLLALALALAGYGIYALAKKDVQAGVDEAGAAFLGLASLAAVVGGPVVVGRRRA